MRKYKLNTILLTVTGGVLLMSSCMNLEGKRTTISVVDPDRHYPPILHGHMLEVIYTVENTGDEPLIVKDIHVSGGCELLTGNNLKALPAGGKGFIHILYNGNKNIGHVKNYVEIYANLKSGKKEELTFDLNVVPNSLYTKDYEEVFIEESRASIEGLVDGAPNERRYSVY